MRLRGNYYLFNFHFKIRGIVKFTGNVLHVPKLDMNISTQVLMETTHS